MTQLAIDVSGLTKRYDGRAVVDHIALQVGQGRICGFLGPNGSGKTTTIRMLCGLLTPDGGSGTCLGLDIIRDAVAIKRQVGYMTQKFGLYDDLSIRENLDFVARLFELPRRKQAVDAALQKLGLEARQTQLVGSLSGGWKQRLALAACLIHEPRLLLLDEPTAGVDPKARREFWDQIHALAAQDVTVLVSTHYMDEAERCHDLVYIAYGHILARGTEREIIDASDLKVWSIASNSASNSPEASANSAQSAANLGSLVAPLRSAPGVLSVAAFGNAVHVAGTDAVQVEHALAPLRSNPALQIAPAAVNLEDVFINLIATAPDNFTPAVQAPKREHT